MGFKFNFFLTVFPEVLPYLKNTLWIAIAAYVLSFILSIIVSVCRALNVKGLYKFFEVYISFFRSTPLVTQLFFIYLGLPQILPIISEVSEMTILIVVMALNQTAFMSEIIRGAFLSIPKGQYDAAKSIGMTTNESLRHIIIPQVIRIALPGMINSVISLIKGTSMGYTIGVLEMMTASRLYSARTFRQIEVYTALLLIYWAIVLIITKTQSRLENRLNRGYV
ncbi:MAG: amino acid ABC transporter permease [Clostridium sp.]|nr:amino acid ABC transporter permease [Clostridium sp.]